VLHLLIEELRAQRKEFAGLIILSLEVARKDGWKHFVTGADS
jgi:hypothetical protein